MKPASLNHTYRLVWSDRLHAFVAVAEFARARGKRASGAVLAAACLAVLPGLGFAANLPEGGRIVAGSGSIAQSGNTMTVSQSTDRMAADWQSFSIGQGYAVNFVQPSASSIALNRVLGSDVSRIQGSLTANGQVFLVNPNGVLFTPTARVEVGGLVASTRDLSVADFMAGNYRFSGGGNAAIRNEGEIKVGAGGTAAFIAAKIENVGRIEAPKGNVLMAAADTVRLDLGGPLKLEVDKGALDALIEQGGAILADGGRVLLTAQAADEIATAVINHTGITEAKTLATGERGEILLLADMKTGQANVGGRLDASAPAGGDGGFIETSAAKVKVQDGAQVKAGHWLIDPNDFTIAASGGDITGATLSSSLNSGNVIIQSASGGTSGNGDIFVRDGITWNAATKLTLSAYRNIEILADITAEHANGKVALEYGQGAPASGNTATYSFGLTGSGFTGRINLQPGGNFFTKLGSDGTQIDYTVITSLGSAGSTTGSDLQGMQGNLSGNYALGANINASATSGWNSNAGFAPIGNDSNKFTGRFDGLGHTISGLTIDRPSTGYIGLFGYTQNALIQNVGLVGGSVMGSYEVGGLVGGKEGGAITQSYATGSVSGNYDVGGLVGWNGSGAISNSYATGYVSGSNYYVGGLVGYNEGTIIQSYATGSVTGSGYSYNVGGLVGVNDSGAISNSYATGNVSGTDKVGGLVGWNDGGGTISNSYATGNVTGSNNYVGGLVGLNDVGAISNSHYNIDSVLINGGHYVTLGGLFDDQYNDWITDKSLNIGYYSTTLVPTTTNTYKIDSVQGMKHLLGFADISGYTFQLANDIDLSSANGLYIPYFAGTFDGQNHRITNLDVNQNFNDYIGLFGRVASGATIKNVGVDGSVRGNSDVGGLVGRNDGTISNSYANVNVFGNDKVGGLVGFSYGSITQSYATGSVTGSSKVGGLVGFNETGTITQSYATGSVTGSGNYVGGLVGWNGNTITQSYATGSVSGSSSVGGLVGLNDSGAISNSFYDMTTTGQSDTGKGEGKTTAEMKTLSTFSGWDIDDEGGTNKVWRIYGGQSYPLLRGFLTPLTVTANSGSRTYDGTTNGLGVSYSTTPNANLLGTATVTADGKDVGSHTLTVSGLYSNQRGYDVSYATGTLTITARTVNLTGSRVYDGTNTVAAAIFTLDNLVSGEDLTLSGSGAVDNKNVGDNKPVTLGSLALGNGATGSATNYTLTGGTHTASITPKALSLSGLTANDKTYDGTTAATLGSPGTLSGVIGTDDVSLAGAASASFADKNAGTGKTVTVSGLSLTGTDAGNYTLGSGVTTTTASILPKALTASYTAQNKTYDGTTTASVSATSVDIIGSDEVNITASGAFADKNAGNGKTVNISGGALSGTDAGNYYLTNTTGTASADITPKALSLSGLTAHDKTYDGTTAATLGSLGTLSGVIGADAVSLAGAASASFADKNAGTGKTVTVSGLSLTGTDAGNYTLGSGAIITTASILPKALTISGSSAQSKTYDGNTTANITAGTLSDLVGSETLNVSASGTFADKNAGTNKNVSVTYTLANGTNGGLASNYTLAGETLTADITPRPVTVTADAKSKTQGQSDPALTYTTGCAAAMGPCGLVTGDTLTGSLTRAAGEAVGSYAIQQGTVDDAHNPNYAISYVGADLTITAASGGGAPLGAALASVQAGVGNDFGAAGSGGGNAAPGGEDGGGNTGGGNLQGFAGAGDGGGITSPLPGLFVVAGGIRLPEDILPDDEERTRK